MELKNLIRVMTKAHRHLGQYRPAEQTKYLVEIKKGKSITICDGQDGGAVRVGRTFNVGDKAEYDSYNLSYIGEITAITEKTVSIVAYKGTQNEKLHRLDMNTFCWRNFNFDFVRAEAENSETMMHI